MSLLDHVSMGKIKGPQFNVICGVNGVGKTTWATSFPKSICVDLEDGSKHLDVARIGADKFPDLEKVRAFICELRDKKHDYKTLVIDSAEALEALICDFVCKEGNVKSVELYDGGYGKGIARTREIMREIILEFNQLKQKGIEINLVAHTQVKTISDPTTNQSYDRVIMRTNDKMAAVIRDLADNVFFATYKVFTVQENKKTKAVGEGQRVMYTQWRPGFDAKNRLNLPHELALSYDAFMEALGNTEIDSNVLAEEITQMASKITDEKFKKTVSDQIEKFKNNPAKLNEVKNRLMAYVSK